MRESSYLLFFHSRRLDAIAMMYIFSTFRQFAYDKLGDKLLVDTSNWSTK